MPSFHVFSISYIFWLYRLSISKEKFLQLLFSNKTEESIVVFRYLLDLQSTLESQSIPEPLKRFIQNFYLVGARPFEAKSTNLHNFRRYPRNGQPIREKKFLVGVVIIPYQWVI